MNYVYPQNLPMCSKVPNTIKDSQSFKWIMKKRKKKHDKIKWSKIYYSLIRIINLIYE